MLMLQAVVLYALVVLASVTDVGKALCSTNHNIENRYKFFNTRTLYDSVRGQVPGKDSRAPPECSPKHIFLLARHGSRYPGSDKIETLESLQKLAKRVNSTGTAKLCEEEIKRIKAWRKDWYDPVLREDLAPTGYYEMRNITKRLRETFPEILAGAEDRPRKYRFISSDRRRTIQSALAVQDELYENKSLSRPDVEIDELLLHFYDYCQKYIVEIDENDTVIHEVDKFYNGPHMHRVLDNLARNLGIPREEVTVDLAKRIKKDGCANEEWATGNDSSWCLAFSKEDLKVLEYAEDMKDYFVKSYAHEINHKQACPLKMFILSALKNASKSEVVDSPLFANFAFAHSKTMAMLMTEMQIIPDDGPFTADDYSNQQERLFRTSFYTPGASNLVFVLYECKGYLTGMKLQIFMNEEIVKMPLGGANTSMLWDFENALEHFKFYDVPDCSIEEICKLESEQYY